MDEIFEGPLLDWAKSSFHQITVEKLMEIVIDLTLKASEDITQI
jgi:hypothetical protein